MNKDLVIENENKDLIIKTAKKLEITPIFLSQKKDSYFSKEHDIHISKATRSNIENKQLKYHYFAEYLEEKDAMHHRRSGFNQILMNLMKEKQKILIITIEQLLEHEDKPLIIGRIKQNLKLAQKFDVEVKICSFASKPENLRPIKEMQSFIKTLGYEQIAKESVNY